MNLLTKSYSFWRNTVSCMIIYFLLCQSAISQKRTDSSLISDIAEELSLDYDDISSASNILELLEELADTPININEADEKEISRLFFLSGYQIKSLIYHIQTTGKIMSIYEIASIPGFSKQIAERMSPFLILENTSNISNNSRARRDLITNLSFKPGEKDTTLLGSHHKILTKYKASHGKFQYGFTIEKDAGERFIDKKTKTPDFLSGYVMFDGDRFLKRLVIGDYVAKIGQGININTKFITSISLTGNDFSSGKDDIKGHTSSDENNFFRGIAAEFGTDRLNMFLMFSHHDIDATIETDADSEHSYVVGLYDTGLHTKETYLKRKNALTETSYMGNISYNFNMVKVGVTWSRNQFSIPFRSTNFTGDEISSYSGYYHANLNRVTLYGEISTNDFKNKNFVQGVKLRPDDRLSVNVLYRNYSAEYISFHGRGPGLNSNDETGLFGNFKLELSSHLFITSGIDLSKKSRISYRNNFPTKRLKAEIRADYEMSDKIGLQLAYTVRTSTNNGDGGIGMPSIEERKTKGIKATAKFQLSESFALTLRTESKKITQTGSRGYATAIDVNYRFRTIPMTIWFRSCLFKTDDWDSRIYLYENDLLYSYSVPALSGEGYRNYLMIKYSIGQTADIRVKYSIKGLWGDDGVTNTDELKFQLKLRF